MSEEVEALEAKIKTKFRFGWTPFYEEEVSTSTKGKQFIALAIKTFEKLGWTVVYYDDESVEAKREDNYGYQTEKISAKQQFGKVTIRSTSLRNEFLDWGRNSKRVKVFVQVFDKLSSELTTVQLAELENQQEQIDTMSDYVIPETLPLPNFTKTPSFITLLIGCVLCALLFGLLNALPSTKGFYIIGLFEIVTGLMIGFVFEQFIRLSNYTTFNKLHQVLIAMVAITCVSSQYFQYRIILPQHSTMSFVDFMSLRLEAGLTIKTLDTGMIGLIISWIIQLVLIYLVGMQRLGAVLIQYSMQRVPQEVIDFALYHILQKKSENIVRSELAKKGWKNVSDQDLVMEAIGAIQTARNINRE